MTSRSPDRGPARPWPHRVRDLVRRRCPDEKDGGQILLLSMAFGAITLVLVLVVAAVSSIYLERKELLALADALAADAADSVAERAYYGPGGDGDPAGPAAKAPAASSVEGAVPLSDASVEAAVRDYLAAAPDQVVGEFEDFGVVAPTGTPDGATAVVTLSARARPPMVPWVLLPWADGFAIEVTARAQAT